MTVQITELTGVAAIISGTLAIISAFFQHYWRIIQIRRLRQEEERLRHEETRLHQEANYHRESHNLKLFEALSSNNHRLQLAAAAVLAERLASNANNQASNPNNKDKGEEEAENRRKEAENHTIIRALLAVTKDLSTPLDNPIVPREISKFVADIVKNHGQPLKQFDWQNTRLSGAWWEGVNASGIDFWQADLSQAGFRKVIFRDSVLTETKLDGSVLVGADLTNAKLQRASLLGTDLRETKLEGANFVGAVYDERTRFPDGFDPKARRLIAKTTAPV